MNGPLAALVAALRPSRDRRSRRDEAARPADLERLVRRARADRIPRPLAGIEGWLSERERRTLYGLARRLEGPVLEIGAWCGLSTVCIAYGIQDRGARTTFVTTELNPRLENFRPWQGGVGFFVPAAAATPCGVASVELFERDIRPILARPGGVLATLKANLARCGVADLVTVVEGHFGQAPPLDYRFVFADAMHDASEIARNAPVLSAFLRPGAILACHDSTRENEAVLRSQVRLGRSVTVDSLFVGEVTA